MITLRQFAILAAGAVGLLAVGGSIGTLAGIWIEQSDFFGKVERRLSEMTEAANTSDVRTLEWTKTNSTLLPLEIAQLPIGLVDGVEDLGGGGLAEVGDTLIFSTARGALGFINLRTSKIGYFTLRVPMNFEALVASPFWSAPQFDPTKFRVLGLRYVVSPAQDEPKLYAMHHSYDGDCVRLAISRVAVGLVDGEPHFEQALWERAHTLPICLFPNPRYDPRGARGFPGIQSGGGIVQHEPDKLLFGVGDLGQDLVEDPKLRDTIAGVFEYNIATGEVRPYSIGHRNPQGLGIDRTGRVWETEHGKSGGDEVNLIIEGRDYGFPWRLLGLDYGGGDIDPGKPYTPNPVQGRHEGYELPRYAFLPSVAPNKLTFIDGAKGFALWDGDMVIATLRAASLYRLRIEQDRVLYSERIHLGHRIRDITQLQNGWLAVLTEFPYILLVRESGGERSEQLVVAGYTSVRASESDLAADTPPEEEGRMVFLTQCGGCHATDGVNDIGPHLANLIGRPLASVQGFGYSDAMLRAGGTWTRSRLSSYLDNPQGLIPGTTMPQVQIDSTSRDLIIGYLEQAAF